MADTYSESKAKDLEQEISGEEPKVSAAQEDYAQELRARFGSISSFFESHIFPKKIRGYKNAFLYAGDRHLELLRNKLGHKSNIKYPLIKSVHDTYFSNTFDSETKIKVIPHEEQDKEKAESVQMYTDWAFTIADAEAEIKKMDYEAVLIGQAYGRTGFKNQNEKITYLKNGTEATENRQISQPMLYYVDFFTLFYNPSASDFYNTPKFYRDILTMDQIKGRYDNFVEDITEQERVRITQFPKYFTDKDYRRVKLLKGFESTQMSHNANTYLNGSSSASDHASGLLKSKSNTDSSFTDDNIFTIDWRTDLLEVVEYWEPERFSLVINGYLVYDGPSPHPYEGDPFVRTAFKEVPGVLFAEGITDILESIQTNVDAFVNNWIDVVNGLANPPFIADKGVFGEQTPQFFRYQSGKVYERVAQKTIERINLVDPAAAGSLLSGIQFFISQAYELVGLNSYTQGGEGKIERTAGGVTNKVQILKTALVPFFRNKNHSLAKIGERWLADARTRMPEKISVRVFGEDGVAEFKDITQQDLIGKFDFYYDNQSLKSITRIEERTALNTALQYAQMPETQIALEEKLLETFDISTVTFEDKKKAIDQQLELEQYKQTRSQELLGPAPGQGQPGVPQVPGAPIPGQVPETGGDILAVPNPAAGNPTTQSNSILQDLEQSRQSVEL